MPNPAKKILFTSERTFHLKLRKYIKQSILDNNTSTSEIARRLGVARQQVYELTQGRCIPNLRSLVRIAKVFGCRVEIQFIPEDDDE